MMKDAIRTALRSVETGMTLAQEEKVVAAVWRVALLQMQATMDAIRSIEGLRRDFEVAAAKRQLNPEEPGSDEARASMK